VAGGAGKTPTALWLVGELKANGYRPVFLTRGYGGTLSGPILVDLAHHTATDIGDEAPLLARVAPTIVARDRSAGARHATEYGDVIIMDDGLQNSSLEKQMTLVVIDSKQGIGNGYVIPAGPLRAPLSTQLKKIDASLVIGEDRPDQNLISKIGKAIFFGRLAPNPQRITELKGRNVYAFAGIGQPDKFFDTLSVNGINVKRSESFADHYVYSRNTISSLLMKAQAESLTLITTAKDMVRIRTVAPDLADQIAVLDIRLVCDDGAALVAMIINQIKRKRDTQAE
jgi:tetraacyldisaccharide 4'-kinase